MGKPIPEHQRRQRIEYPYAVRTMEICPKCGKETHPGDMVEGERVWCVWCFDGIERED